MNDDTMNNNAALFQDADAPGTEALTHVHDGMGVVDSTGEEVGTVEFVKMGNPRATTMRGSTDPGGTSIVGMALDAAFGDEPDLPAAKRSQLLRYGYIKVDGSGLGDTDGYVRGDKVADVSGDTVRLTVRKEQLLTED